MRSKLVIRLVLLGLVAIGIGRWAWTEFGPSTPVRAAIVRPDGVTVISLHGDKRCRTCLRISELAEDEIRQRFATEIREGRLHWDRLNYQTPGNEDLVPHYEIVSSTLVVSRWQNGEETGWQRLDEVWDLVGDEASYRDFIAARVATALDPP